MFYLLNHIYFRIIQNIYVCVSCEKIIQSFDITWRNNGQHCSKCKLSDPVENRSHCSNTGCTYKGNELETRKHYIWLCDKSQNKCKDCKEILSNQSMMDHLQNSHKLTDTKTINNLCVLKIDKTLFEISTVLRLYIKAFDVFFRVYCLAVSDQLCMSLVSDLSIEETKKFECCLKICSTEFPESYSLEIALPNVSDSKPEINRYSCDFILTVPIFYTKIHVYNRDIHYLELVIKKNK